MLPVDALFSDLPELRLAGAREERAVRNGSAAPCRAAEGRYRVYSESGEFLMLGAVKDGVLRTIKSFFEV